MIPDSVNTVDVDDVMSLVTHVVSDHDVRRSRAAALEGVTQLVAAQGAALMTIEPPLRSSHIHVLAQHELTWPQQRAIMAEFLVDPLRPALEHDTNSASPTLVVHSRRESRIGRVAKLWATQQMGDGLYVLIRPAPHRRVALVITRAIGSPSFSGRDQLLAQLLLRHTWAALVGDFCLPTADAGAEAIPDRLGEVLLLLQGGYTPAEISGMLHISRHTVYDHIKKLHRLLGVSSRTELLAVTRNRRIGGFPRGKLGKAEQPSVDEPQPRPADAPQEVG